MGLKLGLSRAKGRTNLGC